VLLGGAGNRFAGRVRLEARDAVLVANGTLSPGSVLITRDLRLNSQGELNSAGLRLRAKSSTSAGLDSAQRARIIEAALQAVEKQLGLPRSGVGKVFWEV